MAKTLLAVDDSVTMRKVLEITFSGEDFRVVTADTTQGALAKVAENPQVCVIDTALGGEDGYALAKELRKRSPQTSIILLASRYAPYDQARGRDAGVDDWADKPFDTQQLIDKVRKVLLAKEAGGVAPTPAAPPVHAPAATPASVVQSAPYRAPAAVPAVHAAASALGRGTQQSLGGAVPQRPGTLTFGEGAPSGGGASPPRPAPVSVVAAPPATGGGAPAPSGASAAVASAVNGQLAGKLGDLGLTRHQAEAVLALSREVVERVVWEVVPQLAEALIKEEIARLMKE